ncbi:MAG TPA: DsbA family oxidoreductase [Acidimicrobiales bacterium]|nr:DsbA family oxidoreductase [Acidimicrobiales bacterium]
MLIEVWSDVVCPWCYVGKRNLEAALAVFEHSAEVDVVWRSFELDPNAPTEREGGYADRLARKYGVSPEEAQAMIDRMTASAAAVGLTFRFDIARPGNSLDAHRLLHLGAARGLQGELKEHLLRATFTEGEAIGDRETLARLARDVGLVGEEVDEVLRSDRYASDVHDDEARAASLDIHAVPFFLVDGYFALGGAQPPRVLLRVLERAWSKGDDDPIDRPHTVGLCDEDDVCAT